MQIRSMALMLIDYCHLGETFLCWHDVQVDVQRLYVGNLMTALDMAGFSLSLLQLDDTRLQRLDAATQVHTCMLPALMPKRCSGELA